MSDTPRTDSVICPNCSHQFQAICINDKLRVADLLAALKMIVPAFAWFNLNQLDKEILAQAKAAIAKAQGVA